MADAYPRTYLFVPANRPERFDKALAAGADAVIIDLEDAVSPADKDAARAGLATWLAAFAGDRQRLLVRINDGSTPWFADDLQMVARFRWQAVMLPKVETPEQVARVVGALGPQGRVVPLIESAAGVLNVEAVARAPGVQRLAFGTLDYALDVGLSGDERGFIEPSTRIALASRVAGIAPPVAGVTPDIQDERRLLDELAFARAFGFTSKLCIHPKQVAPIHTALAPSAADVEWARRVLAAVEGSSGAVQLDGKMIDRPVLLKAQAILAAAP
ncbi:MAG: CoA ester lyase [Burkholderiaceae bacterium]